MQAANTGSVARWVVILREAQQFFLLRKWQSRRYRKDNNACIYTYILINRPLVIVAVFTMSEKGPESGLEGGRAETDRRIEKKEQYLYRNLLVSNSECST